MALPISQVKSPITKVGINSSLLSDIADTGSKDSLLVNSNSGANDQHGNHGNQGDSNSSQSGSSDSDSSDSFAIYQSPWLPRPSITYATGLTSTEATKGDPDSSGFIQNATTDLFHNHVVDIVRPSSPVVEPTSRNIVPLVEETTLPENLFSGDPPVESQWLSERNVLFDNVRADFNNRFEQQEESIESFLSSYVTEPNTVLTELAAQYEMADVASMLERYPDIVESVSYTHLTLPTIYSV